MDLESQRRSQRLLIWAVPAIQRSLTVLLNVPAFDCYITRNNVISDGVMEHTDYLLLAIADTRRIERLTKFDEGGLKTKD